MSRNLSRRELLGLEAPPASPADASLLPPGAIPAPRSDHSQPEPGEPVPELPALSGDSWIRVHRQAMACRFEVTLSSDHARFVGAARDALLEADALEERLSIFREGSEVTRLNARAAAGPVNVSEVLFDLVEAAARLHAETQGAFDVTATPLLRAWGFLRREGRLPDAAALAAARSAVGMHLVERDAAARSIRFLRPGMELSFGSIGKGYALDRMKARLVASGVPAALLSAGGSSLVAFGAGDGFPVDVTSPRVARPLFGLRLRDAAQATSGAGVQFFESEGRRYGHVLDPRSGHPVSGVLSATVVTRSATEADALSTAFLVAGPALAESYCAGRQDTLALLVPEDEPGRRQSFGASPGAHIEERA